MRAGTGDNPDETQLAPVPEPTRGGEDTRRRGWFRRMIDGSAGLRPKLPLADPRLEALRRFVCRVRDRADVSELKPRLIELGFHPDQISAVALIAR